MALNQQQRQFLMATLHVPPAPRGGGGDGMAGLAEAPGTWIAVRGQIDQRVGRLKSAVLAEFSGDSQPLLAEIGKTMAMLDAVLARLDHTLAAHLADAHSAAEPQARSAALAKCEALLASHRAYVDAEPLIGHIDDNPLGMPTGIRALLDDALGSIEQALRR